MLTRGRRTRQTGVTFQPNINKENMTRKEELNQYISDFEAKVLTQIEELEKLGLNVIESIQGLTRNELLTIPEKYKKMTKDEFLMHGGFISSLKENDPTEEIDNIIMNAPRGIRLTDFIKPSDIETPALQKSSAQIPVRQSARIRNQKQPSQSISRTYNKGKRTMIKKENRTFSAVTPLTTRSNEMPLFTPKFDPRLPLTPATGLRNIRPGEKFIVMSLSGSPLGNTNPTAPASTLLTLQDGKSISITAEDDIDEDTRSKLRILQEKLKSFISLPKCQLE